MFKPAVWRRPASTLPGLPYTLALCAWGMLQGGGCVTSGTHEAVLAKLAETEKKLSDKKEELGATTTSLTQERDAVTKEKEDCVLSLNNSRDQNVQLVAKVQDMGQNVEQLLEQKGQLAEERSALSRQIDELRRMRALAEARNKEYRTLLSKLSSMIDAGTLQVKVRNGSMVVQMSSDVVFPPGGTGIKREARGAIEELARTIAQFEGRRFQVAGHSDPTPINTARFPSNWELSAQRAIEVVKLLIEAGVPPEMLNAAGNGEFDPLVSNDTPEERAINRRVEIIFLPKIEELPGFGDVGDAAMAPSSGQQAKTAAKTSTSPQTAP